MKQNVGSADKYFRYILGAVIIGLGFYFKSWFGLIGIVPIITASIGWCPAYMPFGISTCKTKQQKS
ncbi:MAG: DUF2892 domain-containing protein [bacterium]